MNKIFKKYIFPAIAILVISFGAIAVNADIYNPTDISSSGGASLSGNNVFTGQNTFTNANQTNIANLDTTLYADQFAGGDIGAQVNAAYAACPTNGCNIVIGAGTFTQSTPIVFSTVNKRTLLQCSAGGATVLNYTGGGTSIAVTINDGALSVGSGNERLGGGIDGCTFNGPSGAGTTVGVFVGGTNGAQGVRISNVNIQHFGTGFQTGANTWVAEVYASSFSGNDFNVIMNSPSNSGENTKFTDDLFNDSLNTSGAGDPLNCVILNTSASPSIDFLNSSFDDCQLVQGAGNSQVTITGGHFENPVGNVKPAYDFISIADGSHGTTNMSIYGTQFLNDATTSAPVEFIKSGGSVRAYGVTVTKGASANSVGNFITNDGSFGSALVQGLVDNAGNAVNFIVDGRGPTGGDAINGFDFLSAKLASSPFAINQNSSGIANFYNAGAIAGNLNQSGLWELGDNVSSSAVLSIAGSRSAASWTTNGLLLKLPNSTLTDTTSTGTVAVEAASSILAPTFAASSATTFTNGATLYIANAPTAGTNVTLTNANALYVANGSSAFLGGIATGGANTQSNFYGVGGLIPGSTGAATVQFGGSSAINMRSMFNGITTSTIGIGNNYANLVIGASPLTTPATGTNSWLTNLAIKAIGTVASGGATITNSASLYIDAASAAATNNYAFYVNSGNSLFGGSVLLNGGGGVGYTTGAGGTVIQATSKSTGVTLNTFSGTITMNAEALSSATIASFTVTDSKMGANDVVVIQHDSGGTLGVYTVDPSTSAAGSFVVNVRNDGTVPLSEALVLRFAIIKGSVN